MSKISRADSADKTGPKAFIFIGRSGCGKGTQVELFKDKLKERGESKTLHVETGSFFREFIKGNSFTEILSKRIVDSGGLMPEAFAIYLWVNYLNKDFTGKEDLLFDGVARKLHEATILDGALKFYGIKKYKVIYLNVSEEWATDRLLARAGGRKDDTEEGIKNRMKFFEKEVVPSIDFFRNNKDCNFVDINGEQSIDEVHEEIVRKVF